MVSARPLRIVSIASFIPAFPLSVAHGVLSDSPLPAVGLVPLAFSASISTFLLLRQTEPRDNDGGEEARRSGVEEAPGGEHNEVAPEHPPRRPLLVFVVDTVTATALIVVLVFTWIQRSPTPELAMLAAYATIPLLVNFLIHLYLAVRELSRGLALHSLTQWLAWQAVPPDCPHCGNRLRPSSPPQIPWYHESSTPSIRVPALPNWKLPVPSWETPAWLKGRNSRGYTSLFVSEDDGGRYRDDDPVEHGEGPSTRVEEPAEVEIVGKKKDRKSKDAPLLGDDTGSWDS